MELEGAEVLQILISDFNLKEILKESFVKDLEEQYDNIKIIGLNIVVNDIHDEKLNEVITIKHPTPSNEEKNQLLLDVRTPENIPTMFEIIKNQKGR